MLTVYGPRSLLAVKTDLLAPLASVDGKASAAPAAPSRGEWVVIGGVAEGVASLGGRHPLLFRPFGWTAGPRLMNSTMPATGGGTDTTPTTPAPPKAAGAPSFFGL
jgi:hypothetical protein